MLDIALAASSEFCSGLLTTIEPSPGGEPTWTWPSAPPRAHPRAPLLHVPMWYVPTPPPPSLGLLP